MAKLISITELAKLRNVSTETLRYYDRIGLLCPTYRNPKDGTRYYSIYSKDEKLGTIKELQSLGLSIKEIKEFLNERSLLKSYQFFTSKEKEIELHIKELTELQDAIKIKAEYLKNMIDKDFNYNDYFIKNIDNRIVTINTNLCNSNTHLEEDFFDLETHISGTNNAIGTERFCVIPKINSDLLCSDNILFSAGMFINATKCDSTYKKITIPKGKFICKYINGSNFCSTKEIIDIINFCKDNGYIIRGNLLKIYIIDVNITDNENEMVCELQVPIK